MVARIGQQLRIRHPESVDKAVLAAANPALLFPPGDGEELRGFLECLDQRSR